MPSKAGGKPRGSSTGPPASASTAAPSGTVGVAWCVLVIITSVMLVSICFSYSWAGFKLDMKGAMGWDENAMATIFMFATIGQNFVVHMGMLSDATGIVVTGLVAAVMKAAGLGGMWWGVTQGIDNPLFYGAMLFLDTQAMSAVIIVGQKEVQKVTPEKYGGIAASVCTGAFGFGAVFMVYMYDNYFRPDFKQHFAFAGAVSAVCILVNVMLTPTLSKMQGAQGKKKKAGQKDSFWGVALSLDYAYVFSGMVLTWGLGMVWNANMPSFSHAAGLTNGAAIRGTFYTSKTIGCLAIGPLCAFLSCSTLYFLTCVAMCGAGALMLVSSGTAMMPAATVAGFCFGAIATLVPLMSKQLSLSLMGTLYSLSKMGGMFSGVAWNYIAGYMAQQNTQPGQKNCVGEECYRFAWVCVLGSAAPLLVFMAYWSIAGGKKAKTD